MLPLLFVLMQLCLVSSVTSQGISRMYGRSGENWRSTGPLSDYSFAGYAGNQKSIPKPSVVADVTNFGAVGDGITDDTESILQAIAVASEKKGAVYFPPGTYVVTKRLAITTSSVVLRGAGQDQTVLYFPKSLTGAYGPNNRQDGAKTKSIYGFRDGFITIIGGQNKQKLAGVTKAAPRGSRRLYVTSTQYLKAGNWMKLYMSDPGNGSLFKYLYANQEGDISGLMGRQDVVRFSSRITAVGPNYIELERPLAHDVRTTWKPEVHSLINSVQNVGVESLTIKFRSENYAGHLKEKGFNGIFGLNAMNIWIRDVDFLNVDSAIFLFNMDFTTVQRVKIAVTKDRSGDFNVQGHHGISVASSTELDVSQFTFTEKWYHDITATFYSFNVVFRDGQGKDLNLDNHKGAPHSVLFANLNVGAGKRPFQTESGRADRGRNSASNTTFWNIYDSSGGPISLPPCTLGPMLNFVGYFAGDTCAGSKWRVEKMSSVTPTSLVRSMIDTRSTRFKRIGSELPVSYSPPPRSNPPPSPPPPPSTVPYVPGSPVTVPVSPTPSGSIPAGYSPAGSSSLRTPQNTSFPYLALMKDGSPKMSKYKITWQRYQNANGDVLFSSNGRWLSNDGPSKCLSLKAYGTSTSDLRKFKLLLLANTSPKRYFITTGCSSDKTYLGADLRLTRDTSRRASWIFEN